MVIISGMTVPPDIELKNCLLFSCSAIFASNNGAVTPLVNKNFSYLVLENLYENKFILLISSRYRHVYSKLQLMSQSYDGRRR